MKKTLHIATAAVLALFAWSCAESIGLDEPEGQEITITASFAENPTKTTLQDGGTQVLWESGDEIKVFYGTNGSRFTSTLTSSAATSDFSGNLNFVFGSNEGVGGSKYLWAVYPYRSDATSDGASITTTLPAEQIGRAGSFAKGTSITLAKSNSFNMGFYNVCGGVRFSVTHSDVKNVVFKALNGENIAGRVKLAFDGGAPAVQEVTEGVDSIVLAAPATGCFDTGKWYYIVAIPGTLSGGFKMTFNTDTKYAVLKSTDSRTISRSKFGSLADADEDLVYKDKSAPGPGVGNIVFKDNVAKVACVEKFDTNADGELSYDEAAAVTSINGLFADYNTVTSFDELKHFTGITYLGYALKGLKNLKSVTIPAGFTSLEDYAFEGCSALDSVTFAGNAVKTIGNYAFHSCTSLKEINLSSAVESIGFGAFMDCSALESIEIPSAVTSIKSSCFEGCSALKNVGIPSGVKSIEGYSFDGCKELESVDFPSGLTSIGVFAFRSCKKIKTVSLPNSVTSIDVGAFYGCSSLESAILPPDITTLPADLFCNCYKLYAVTFPTAVESIFERAFYNCLFYNPSTNVSKIDLPETVTRIGPQSFNIVRNVLVHSNAMVSIGINAFSMTARLFVPDSKVETYKIRTNWSSYVDHIFALSSYSDFPVIEAVDLGLSVKWATCNIGAAKPEECGWYFACGDVAGQIWNGSSWSGGGFSTNPSSELDSNNNLKPKYDAAHVNLGGSWRMPTKAEQQELIDNCTATWTSDYNGTGVAGRIFTSNKTGYTDKSIFLPAAGRGEYSGLLNAGSYGYYWSCTFPDGYAWCLFFRSGKVYTYSDLSYRGQSVRPVSE